MTRIAVIDRIKCIKGRGCDFICSKYCPVNRNKGECVIENPLDNKAQIDEDLCIGCMICTHRCPTKCISIVNLPEKLKELPIIRFGANAFELFRLPIPKMNSVVGIIGRNGIGKSTALNILTGAIKPNLGNYEKELTEAEIIAHYSNVFLGNYFVKLFDKKMKLSYKPQRIELLPKLYSGKVIDLLKSIDEKGMCEELIKELDLENLKERNLKDLSGGELQKVSIIAAAIKDSDIYYFDEPASFCDITARIKIAKIIKTLAKENTAVIVVEHDLATLDYISDEIQIFYGEQSVFGVVSQSKAVRRGINEYLDGYLPDDNVRFRDYAIKFEKGYVEKYTIDAVNFEFPELEKDFEKFSLKTDSGKVRKGEIMGVMGSNGLGKTTFLKMIAGELEPDKGVMEKQRIAYKKQYPSVEVNCTVKEWLKKVAGNKFNSGWFKQNLLEKLGLDKILDNNVNDLSGGELQKVCIAITLAQDCDIYAFDEPSAFIDVEDRLKTAEVIKEFVIKNEVSAIVVDHDVQFMDYISDSMLVFEGEPGKHGKVYGPVSKKEGMNRVLKMLDITYRRDKSTGRPRINKPESQLDRIQRKKGEYYYLE